MKREEANERRSCLPRGIWWGVAGLLFLFVTGSVVSLFIIRRNVSDAISSRTTQFRAGIADLESANPQSAAQEFPALATSTDESGLNDPAVWIPLPGRRGNDLGLYGRDQTVYGSFAGIRDALRAMRSVSCAAAERISRPISRHCAERSPRLMPTAINYHSSCRPSAASRTAIPTYRSWPNPKGCKSSLNAFIPWISSGTPRHILIMLQNPSKIRPAGGFLEAMRISQSRAVRLRASRCMTLPTQIPLSRATSFRRNRSSSEVTRWRPADANWFFDFPTSASETLAFFNQSNLYAATSTIAATSSPYFDTAIAVSPDVVADLLSVVGSRHSFKH